MYLSIVRRRYADTRTLNGEEAEHALRWTASRPVRKLLIGLGVILLHILVGLTASRAQQLLGDNRISVNDTLRIRIGKWNAVENSYQEWVGLSGEYIVGSDGKISLPLAGRIVAADQTTDHVGRELADRLQEEVGLAAPPAASIEIAEFNPIYVIGAVRAAGAQKYKPGMTVVQAVSLAGGIPSISTLPVDTRGRYLEHLRDRDSLRVQRWSLLARASRLEAHLSGAKEIKFHPHLATAPSGTEVMTIERAIFAAQTKAIESRLSSLTELGQLLRSKLEKLKQETALRRAQLDTNRQELENAEKLRQRGLITRPREASAERAVTELEARLIALEVLELSTAQQLSEAERDVLDLRNSTHQANLTSLNQTRQELKQVEVRLKAAELMAHEFGQYGVSLTGDALMRVEYDLRRKSEGAYTMRAANDNDPLKPGDVLEVRLLPTPISPIKKPATPSN